MWRDSAPRASGPDSFSGRRSPLVAVHFPAYLGPAQGGASASGGCARGGVMSLEPLLQASPVIQVHAFAAALAIFVGAVQLFRRKGDALHRTLGRLWVAGMALVALSSFFIWDIRLVWLFS